MFRGIGDFTFAHRASALSGEAGCVCPPSKIYLLINKQRDRPADFRTAMSGHCLKKYAPKHFLYQSPAAAINFNAKRFGLFLMTQTFPVFAGKDKKSYNMNDIPINSNETGEQIVLPFDPPLGERPVADEPLEVDILRAQNAELQTRLKQREARDDVTLSLKSAGARSPELLFEAAARDALQFSDDGSVENAEAVVAEMKRRFPEQFGAANLPSIDGGAGRGGQPAALTKDALAKMKPDEIARLDWATVKQALSS